MQTLCAEIVWLCGCVVGLWLVGGWLVGGWSVVGLCLVCGWLVVGLWLVCVRFVVGVCGESFKRSAPRLCGCVAVWLVRGCQHSLAMKGSTIAFFSIVLFDCVVACLAMAPLMCAVLCLVCCVLWV